MTSNMTAQNVVGSSSRTHIETAHIVGAEEKWRAFRICFSENQRLLSTLVISSLLYYVRWNDVCGPDAFIIASLSPSGRGRCWKTGGRGTGMLSFDNNNSCLFPNVVRQLKIRKQNRATVYTHIVRFFISS
jgi:hypothetical protein